MHYCQLFGSVFGLIEENSLYFEDKRDHSPVKFREPEVLKNEFDFSLNEEGIQSRLKVIEIVRKILDYSNKIPHPHYVFQLLCGGLDPVGVIGDFMSALTSSSMESHKETFLYGRMEQEVFSEIRKLIGYSDAEFFEKPFESTNNTNGYGLVCPGGSVSIITAMYMARKLIRNSPADGKQLVAYISKNTHYSFKKGCILQGIGLNNCVIIDVDSEGKMVPELLRKAICKTVEEGKYPFFAAANAGTTIVGCFDDIVKISEICEEFGLWLHVDGTFGGPMMFSDKYKSMYLKGVEKSHSFNFNPHKWLGLPQECSILVLKIPGTIQKVFGGFGHSDEHGMYSGLQWGRRQNIFKI